MCQLDWATRCPNICSNIDLSVSVRTFWVILTYDSTDRIKQMALPNAGGPQPINWHLNRKTKGWVGGNFTCLRSLSWDTGLLLPLDWNWHHGLSWFSGLHTQTETAWLAFLGPQLANCRSWDFAASRIMWASSLFFNLFVYLFTSICLSISYCFLSLWRTLTNSEKGYLI